MIEWLARNFGVFALATAYKLLTVHASDIHHVGAEAPLESSILIAARRMQ